MKKLALIALLFATQALAYQGSQNPVPENVGAYNQSVFACTSSSQTAVAANPYRDYLFIQNVSANQIQVKFNAAITGTEGVWLAAGSTFSPSPPLVNAIYCKSASGGNINVIEGVR